MFLGDCRSIGASREEASGLPEQGALHGSSTTIWLANAANA